ncbi:hypothetical protein CMI37_18485 [Candidatus Pacearchaeota archaeon]|nr:hypothetical protein [Candidatus Pacearchaeota archaeon]|tara:strand:- start:7380 stop:7604 length:225 start_codon:yes stop_codon:yes gene_type:complete
MGGGTSTDGDAVIDKGECFIYGVDVGPCFHSGREVEDVRGCDTGGSNRTDCPYFPVNYQCPRGDWVNSRGERIR